LVVVLDGAIELALGGIGDGAVVESRRILRVERNRLVEIGDGVVGLALEAIRRDR
jgi:hypothetical protein